MSVPIRNWPYLQLVEKCAEHSRAMGKRLIAVIQDPLDPNTVVSLSWDGRPRVEDHNYSTHRLSNSGNELMWGTYDMTLEEGYGNLLDRAHMEGVKV